MWPWIFGSAVAVVVILVVLIIVFGSENLDVGGPDVLTTETHPSPTNTIDVTDSPAITDNQNETWAIYWYLCGSDLETRGGFASGDLEEMLRIRLPEGVTVIVETGGARDWQRDDIGSDGNYRFVYDSKGFRLVEKAPLSNMGDPSTLADFLRFCNDNYPADKRAVILWNHGGGSVAGLMFDELYGFDSLSLWEMRLAFESATPPSKTKIGRAHV